MQVVVPALLWALVLAACRGCCRLDYTRWDLGSQLGQQMCGVHELELAVEIFVSTSEGFQGSARPGRFKMQVQWWPMGTNVFTGIQECCGRGRK